ncbi:vWA domain-containing protein [Halorubrum sp. CBA1229]|uniref:vWA domain-containing protein n=1 Tax=Halorubrum sp. CBA1229 TaxID=1853699 RepID=UPI000F3D9A3C|nr:vWA domain-containing protein [Halorubrum sp. CBA1229]QKY18070.1 VWA domain-containing protein [Halorubrum sp. CBA1229]
MSDNNGLELSRRRALAGIGAIGVASAGAGIGTSAYFSDEESFDDNSLTAGELDLKLDYKATYAGGPGRLSEVDSWYSADGPGEPFDVQEIEDGTYLIGETPDNTEDMWADEVQNTDLCAPDLGLINGDEIPVFALDDVKPGDSGEVTVSLHVCDNPAWMYMNGALTANDENGQSEPEADVDETGGDPGEGAGELADNIQTTLWYDENCNNVLDGGDDDTTSVPSCVQLVLDTSGSIGGDIGTVEDAANDLANTILGANDDNEVGATTFSGGSDVVNSVADAWSDLTGLGSNGSTNMSSGISDAGDDLANCTGGHDRIMVVFTDGSPDNSDSALSAANDLDDDIELYAIGVAGANQQFLNRLTTGDQDDDSNTFVVAGGTSAEDAIDQVFAQVGQTITGGEEVILEGTLADAMDALEDGIALDGNRSSEEREPFAGAMTHCLGFEWEVPTDVGNEIQTDSAVFDLGFYALQSRHNDDPPAEPFNGTYQDDNGLPSNGTAD